MIKWAVSRSATIAPGTVDFTNVLHDVSIFRHGIIGTLLTGRVREVRDILLRPGCSGVNNDIFITVAALPEIWAAPPFG